MHVSNGGTYHVPNLIDELGMAEKRHMNQWTYYLMNKVLI